MTLLFLSHFSKVQDERFPGFVTYPLDELLFSTLMGLMCGADDWEDIVSFGDDQLDWLKQYLPFHHGIASPDTYQRVFSMLDKEALSASFVSWVGSLTGRVEGVVAIDGKTARGSKLDSSGTGALHMLSAFAHESGLVLGQKTVDAKTNEITVIPDLLDVLALEGCVVTLDAMGTQRAVAQKIIDKKADYVLALKGNQSSLHEDVKLFCEEKHPEVQWSQAETIGSGHGRIETRSCLACDQIDWLQQRHNWPGLCSLVQVTAHRVDKKTGKESCEKRLFISSLPANAERLLALTRAHWSIENTLHWSLDVTFGEDDNRTRKGNAAANLALIRHAAFNILKLDPIKKSIKTKRLKAAANSTFRAQLINRS